MKQAEQARWMLEEFYVSLWAQELGTKGPASLNPYQESAGVTGRQTSRQATRQRTRKPSSQRG